MLTDSRAYNHDLTRSYSHILPTGLAEKGPGL